MKRLLWGLPLALLLGCPLYDDDCSGGQGCAAGFFCDGYSQRCVPLPALPACTGPEQCGASETCAPDGECRPGSCDYYGCVAGYTCSIVDGVHACVAGSGSAVGQDAGADSADAAAPSDAGSPDAAATPVTPVTPVTPEPPDSGSPDASSDAG